MRWISLRTSSIVFILVVMLSGCASQMYEFKDSYNRTTNPPTDWKQQAEFYAGNYLGCTKNQKAMMLVNSMHSEGADVYTCHKVYKVYVIYVYHNGQQIWPIKKNKDVEKPGNELKELLSPKKSGG